MNAAAVRQILSLAWYGLTVGLIQEAFYSVNAETFDQDFSDAEVLDWADKIFTGGLSLSWSVSPDGRSANPCLRA